MAKAVISAVAIQKPARTPLLQRRAKFASSIDQQIGKISSFRAGQRVSKEKFWTDGSGTIFFALQYGRQNLEIERNKNALRAATWDDLLDQLEQIKILTLAGGLDECLASAANATRLNFKAAREKKSGRS